MIEKLEKVNGELAEKMGQFFSNCFNKALDAKTANHQVISYRDNSLYRIMARMETLMYVGKRSLEENYKLDHIPMDRMFTFNTTCSENLNELYQLYVDICQRKKMEVKITFDQLASMYGKMVKKFLDDHILH